MDSSLVLRPYQEKDIAFMVEKGRVLNANEPGLGKTIETLAAWEQLGGGQILVVGPRASAGVWKHEALRWFDIQGMIYSGTGAQRERKWQEFRKGEYTMLIVSYRMLQEVMNRQPMWRFVIADEVHDAGLLNTTSDTWTLFARLSSRYLFLLTGTPVRRGPQDLWPLLHLLAPSAFRSKWSFINNWCMVTKGPFGTDIGPKPNDPLGFRRMLGEYMVRNLKKDVLPELPEKTRQGIPLELTNKQKRLYKQLSEEMFMERDSGILFAQNVASLTLRLRQLLVTPQLLDVDEEGAALEALVELVQVELDAERPVIIFTPFRKAIPFIEKALAKVECTIDVIHGLIKETPHDVAHRFQLRPSKRKILLGTIKTGVSYTAHDASTVFMVGCEWSAEKNKQAEDRAHRIGQRSSVHVRYLLHNGTIDEAVMRRLDEKQTAENWTLSPEEVLKVLESQRKVPLKRR